MTRIASLFILLAVSACAGNSELQPGRGSLRMTVSGKTYDQVWKGVIHAVENTSDDRMLEFDRKLNITIMDKEDGILKADAGVGLSTWGELVGVYITPAHDAPEYTIEIQDKAKLGVGITSKDWGKSVLTNIKKELNQ